MNKHLSATLLALCLVAAGGSAALATESTQPVNACGRLKAHVAATSERAGYVIVGNEKFPIAPGVVAANGGTTVEVGRTLCVTGSQETSSIYLIRYTFYWWPTDDRICGNALSFTAPSGDPMAPDGEVVIDAYFGRTRLVIPNGSNISAPTEGERVCYRIAVDEQGDAVVAAQEQVAHENDRQHVTHCGVVHEHTPATADAQGTIRVGSRAFTIAAGVRHITDAAGPVPDPTVGQAMCLHGSVGETGALVGYLTSWVPPDMAGTASSHQPSTDTAPGIVTLGSLTLEIKPGADRGFELSRRHHCFDVGLDAEGDAVIEVIRECEITGGAAAGQSTPIPAVAGTTALPGLPATSSSPDTSGPPAVMSAIAAAILAMIAAWLTRNGRARRPGAGSAALRR